MRKIEMIGERFGRLTVIAEMQRYTDSMGAPRRRFRCRCDCGMKSTATRGSLRQGYTTSCGCVQRQASSVANKLHGESRKMSPEYISWRAMIQRCENSSLKSYKDYGGRGIRVCWEWRQSFASFLAHIGRRPTPAHTVDRYPDNDGNYEPDNVRWATRAEQNRNRRRKITP